MTAYESMLEDDELFGEYDDDYFVEDEESDDDFAERRRRGRGRSGRRPPNIRVGKTGSGKNLASKPPSKAPVTSASLQASLERVGQDIRANAAAIKSLGAQVKTATAELTAVNNKQDAAIADLRSDLKKQGGSYSQSNQLNMLLPLLQKQPELEPTGVGDTTLATNVLTSVRVKKQDNTLPLIIAMMGAMQPGTSNGQNQMNMMLPMVLLMDK